MFRSQQRHLIAVSLSVICLLLVLAFWFRSPTSSAPRPASQTPPTRQGEWYSEWYPDLDSQHLMLDTQQCYTYFPGLFQAAEDALGRRNGARITSKALKDLAGMEGSYHGMIYEREVALSPQ